VTPTYNRADLLPRLWRSIREQTTRFEWLIVDDGSTDGTLDVVATFEDDRITYVRHSRREGVNRARNSGVIRARAPYVVFVDSDDEVAVGGLEGAVREIAAAEPEIGAVLLVALAAETDRPIARLTGGEVLTEVDVVCRGVLTGDRAVIYRTEVFERQRLPEDLLGCEQVFVYGLTRYYNYLTSNLVLTLVHRQNDNLCDARSVIARSGDIARSHERILQQHRMALETWPAARRRFQQKAIYRYAIAGDFRAAERVRRSASQGLRASLILLATLCAGMIGHLGLERARLDARNWWTFRGRRTLGQPNPSTTGK
jgi:glycosyltransferase involved in cell wall biosynthesis